MSADTHPLAGDLPATTVALRDGTTVTTRSMRPEDDAALLRFHARLSLETTRRRFFTVHPVLAPREVERFTRVDHWDREALVALDGSEIVAVARYDRDPVSFHVAEVAFVVEDRWQGRGLGSALFHLIAERARAAGIDRLSAEVLAENQPMLTVFRHAGVPVQSRFDDGVIHLDLALDAATMSP